MSYKEYGNEGEKEVASLISCPNCKKQLMTLPESYPLYDVQCSACSFRAQIKTSSSNPQKIRAIRGAGWDIMDKVLKCGFLVPSLIINYKWTESGEKHQEIRFYPFITKECLVPRTANIHGGQRVYKMFDYNLNNVPYFRLFSL